MNKLTIDFESRSANDLRKSNPWVYAEHQSTQIMCLALKWNDGEPVVWIPWDVRDLYVADLQGEISANEVEVLLREADVIEAHNVEFEVALWHFVMHRTHGFTDLQDPDLIGKLRCSASVAAYKALPRALGKVAVALHLDNQKDSDGHRLMLKMCKPRKPRKAERESDINWDQKNWWHESTEEVMRQLDYCIQDVNAEYELSERIGDLPDVELRVWQLDQQANYRGACMDLPLVHQMILLRDEYVTSLVAELQSIANISPSKPGAIIEWLSWNGLAVTDLTAATVRDTLLRDDIPTEARRVLEIRQAFAKTSLKKLDTAVGCTNQDGRMRSTLMYSGAATHRWTGKGMQLQNLPSRGLIRNIDACRDLIESGTDVETFAMFYPQVQLGLSSVIRNVITASEGKTLYAADFSSIEGRVLAWLAGDSHIIQGYNDGLDMYKIAAAGVFNTPYAEVTKDQRQIGKIPELAGGYGGGWRAYMAFAVQYGMKPPAEIMEALTKDDLLDYFGNQLTPLEAGHMKWWAPVVNAWRDNRPGTVALWRGLEDAAKRTLKGEGVTAYGTIKFGLGEGFLQCLLPSGRKLYYYAPNIETRDGREQITFLGTDSTKGGYFGKQFTYGGKLCENVVQSLARDVMADAMLRINERAPELDLLFTVHDEIICEGEEGVMSIGEYEDLMGENPDWISDCPIGVEGFKGFRYRK